MDQEPEPCEVSTVVDGHRVFCHLIFGHFGEHESVEGEAVHVWVES